MGRKKKPITTESCWKVGDIVDDRVLITVTAKGGEPYVRAAQRLVDSGEMLPLRNVGVNSGKYVKLLEVRQNQGILGDFEVHVKFQVMSGGTKNA